MADKVSQTRELRLVAGFYDGDTCTIAIDNPVANVTATQINAVGTTLKNTQAILGDKTGAAFVNFKSAEVVRKKKTALDLF